MRFCVGYLTYQPRFGFGVSNVVLLAKIPIFLYPRRRLTPTSKLMNTSNIFRTYFNFVVCQYVTYIQTSKKWGSRVSMLTIYTLPTIRRVIFSNVTASLTTATPSYYILAISLRLRSGLTKVQYPLHSCCMAFFDCFMDEYYQVQFNNLYMSSKSDLGMFNHPKKLMIDGVSRTSIRGLPTQILHQEVTTKERINYVKGTVNTCVLERVPALATCLLVVCSIYDTEPVHFFLMFCDNITWIKKTRRTWDKSTSTMRLGHFLRFSINDSYNTNTNNFNIANQLRGSYCPDRRTRKEQWWWLMLFWGHGNFLVNAYVAYNRHMEMDGEFPMYHYDFSKAIDLAKVDTLGHGAPSQR